MSQSAQAAVELSPRFTFGRAAGLIFALACLVSVSFAVSARFGEQSISLSTALSDSASTDAAIFWSLRVHLKGTGKQTNKIRYGSAGKEHLIGLGGWPDSMWE